MRNLLLVSVLLCAAYVSQAQIGDNAWKTLSKITFKSEFNRKTGEVVYAPVFGKAVERLEGKSIVLEGFIVPTQLVSSQTQEEVPIILSAVPYSSCYFCGGAGKETVIEIRPQEEQVMDFIRMFRTTTNKKVLIEGTLKLNREDPLGLVYILEEARFFEGE